MQTLEEMKIPKRLYALTGFSLKYAPKYCRCIAIYMAKDHRHIKTLKRIKKTISVEQSDTTIFEIHRWRQILQNKFKTVLTIHGEKWMWMNRAFTNIRLWSFEDTSLSYNDKKPGSVYLKLIKNFFRFLPGMIKLKDLSLSIRPVNHFSLLQKLNSMSRILNSLQNLQIKFSWAAKSSNDTTHLHALLENENVLKRLTHLYLGRLANEKSMEALKALPKHCKNLIHLKIDFNSLNSNPQTDSILPFAHFERLEKIEINVDDPRGFVESFRAPQSLKHASFVFGPSGSQTRDFPHVDLKKISKEQPPEDRISQFFNSWNRLENLISLNLTFRCYSKMKELMALLFVEPFLNSLSSLEHLSVDFQDPYPPINFPYGFPQGWSSMGFGQILKALQGVSSKLKSLCFNYPRKSSLTYKQVQENLSFPQVTRLDLHHTVSYPKDISNLLKTFKKPMLKESPRPPIQLDLPYVAIKTNKALLDLLTILKIRHRDFEISLTVMVYQLDLETFDAIFEPFIAKAKKTPRVKGVSLKVQIHEKVHKEYLKPLGFLLEIFKDLKRDKFGKFSEKTGL